MTKGCVYTAIKNLNAFPALNRVSNSLSPSTLITGKPPLNFNHLIKIKYGDYAQVFKETKNDMSERTASAIALYSTGNIQASWYFLSLATGKRITGYQWTVLPITTDVLHRVHDLATAQNQERIEDGGNLTFRWRPDQNAMSFNNDLEEEVDLVNADYVPQDNALLAIEDTQEVTVNDIAPEISDDTINTPPM